MKSYGEIHEEDEDSQIIDCGVEDVSDDDHQHHPDGSYFSNNNHIQIIDHHKNRKLSYRKYDNK